MNHKNLYVGGFWSGLWIGGLLALLVPLSQAQETYGKSDAPVVAEARGVQIRTNNPDEMAYAIKQILIRQYIEEQNLAATDREVAQLLKKKQEVMLGDRRQMEVRRGDIQKELAAENVPDSRRKQLDDELKSINAMQQAMLDADSRAGEPEFAAAEAGMARAFIEQWKVNQALYRQYGGRVTYQQVGAEPLDAYREFLQAAQKSGEFTIVNKDYEPALWSYYTTDSIHRFYPESGKEKEQAINTPWWMLEE